MEVTKFGISKVSRGYMYCFFMLVVMSVNVMRSEGAQKVKDFVKHICTKPF